MRLRSYGIATAIAVMWLSLGSAGPSAADSPSPGASPTAAPSSAPFAATASPAASAPPSIAPSAAPSAQAYANFVKNAERQSGLIDILHKDDDVFLELGAEQLDRPFIVAPELASGVGGVETTAGTIFPSFMLEFKRVGHRVLWIEKNSGFTAPAGSAAANALSISVTDSVINSSPIVAEDESKSRVVVSAAFFLTDFENLSRFLGGSPAGGLVLLGGPPRASYAVDPLRSYVERTKALPKNDEILANLAFVGPPGSTSLAAPDPRGVSLRMHYSIVEPPASSNYIPRLADDRVGYFLTEQKRFDNDALPTPFVRYINRWNFNNGPLAFYLTNEIPAQYKPAIRGALLEWNKAFAHAGIPNAIEVRDQPADAGWDPDDVRYSTVRWITSDRPAFAASGPSVTDPRTGEILRVEIVVDGEALRTVKRGFSDVVAPTRSAAAGTHDEEYFAASGELAAAGALALRAAGKSPAQSERFALDYLRSVILHEAGHDYGLRHNFAAGRLYTLRQIHDLGFTQAHGLAASVMAYNPVNLSPPGQPQGSYFQEVLGPYDYWAIEYGYRRFPGTKRPSDEIAALRRIAVQSTRPEYAYATDEDANGPLAVDPRVATFSLSTDPLSFDRNQFAVADDLVKRLDKVYPRDDRPFYEERRSFLTVMGTYRRAAQLTAKYIGGVYTSRAHRGQAGAPPPTAPVPRALSQRAFAMLSDHMFSQRALHFSPRLLADLGENHFYERGQSMYSPDFPVTDYVATVQDAVMFQLFSADVMTRLVDEGLRTSHPGATMSLGDLFEWMQNAVWDGVGPSMSSVDAVHRGLQRRYTNLLTEYALAPASLLDIFGYPGDTPSLARYELERTLRSAQAGLRSPGIDVSTRAHLEELRSRVAHALDASTTRGV